MGLLSFLTQVLNVNAVHELAQTITQIRKICAESYLLLGQWLRSQRSAVLTTFAITKSMHITCLHFTIIATIVIVQCYSHECALINTACCCIGKTCTISPCIWECERAYCVKRLSCELHRKWLTMFTRSDESVSSVRSCGHCLCSLVTRQDWATAVSSPLLSHICDARVLRTFVRSIWLKCIAWQLSKLVPLFHANVNLVYMRDLLAFYTSALRCWNDATVTLFPTFPK